MAVEQCISQWGGNYQCQIWRFTAFLLSLTLNEFLGQSREMVGHRRRKIIVGLQLVRETLRISRREAVTKAFSREFLPCIAPTRIRRICLRTHADRAPVSNCSPNLGQHCHPTTTLLPSRKTIAAVPFVETFLTDFARWRTRLIELFHTKICEEGIL